MAYRCSDSVAIVSMETVGTDLIVALFSILTKGRAEGSSVVRSLIHRCANLEVSFLRIEQSSHLLLFLEHMALLANNRISQDAVTILAGWTCHPDSKVYAMESRTFLDSLIKCSRMKSTDTETKHQIARVLQNLTLHGSNKAKMTEKCILEQLIELASSRHVCTRLQAIQAIKHISVEGRSKLFIVAFDGGRAVKTLISSVDNTSLRPHVVETLLSLTCKYTASPLANYPGVVEMLALIASSKDDRPAEKAAQSIKRFATHISVSDKGHPAVFNAVLSLSGSPCWRVRRWMAKAFREQSRLSGCSFLLVRSADALRKICDLARDTCSDVCDAAIETILALSDSQSNLKRLSTHRAVLDTLVETVHSGIGDKSSSLAHRNAILSILRLLNNLSARKKVAQHSGIVRSLSRYGTSNDDDDELKKAALHGVVVLSPLMS